jgi:hypothetical protein
LGALILLLAPVTAAGQYWLPGDPPSGTSIIHETALTPPDSGRNEIGIAEVVNLSICSYSDSDIYVDDLGGQEPREDSVGLIEWSLDGPGVLNYNRGAAVVYYAPLSSYDTCALIHVAVHDSGDQYVDPVVYDQVSFDILVPNGVHAEHSSDEPQGTLGPPNNSMRARSWFGTQMLPDTVNFGNVSFRENIALQTFTWPDGTQNVRPAFVGGFGVRESGMTPNWSWDTVDTGGPWLTSHLLVPNSNPPTYQDCLFDVIVDLQFLSDSGYVTFISPPHGRKYFGNTFQSQVGWGSGPLWGSLQGPFQDGGL